MASVDSKKEKKVVSSTATNKADAKKTAEAAVNAKKQSAVEEKKIVAEKKTAENKVAKTADTKKVAEKAPVAKKEAEKKVADTKETAKKEDKKATAKKATEKKVAKKPVEKVEEVYFEYDGQQYLSKEIVEKVKEQYKAQGHRIGAIKTLRIYVNPEEHKAYYVINDKANGEYVEI